MNLISVINIGVKNMPLRKRPRRSFKGKTKNEIILRCSLKRTFFFKEKASLKTFDVTTPLQVSRSNIEGFLKEQFLKETGQTDCDKRSLRNDSTV